jgi:glycogen debranching enzyme
MGRQNAKGKTMKRRSVLGGMVLTAGALTHSVQAAPKRQRPAIAATPVLTSLAIPVTRAENRQYSYTDKVSGYFHGRTHTDDNPDWFNGWNIATKRIFHDYQLSVDGAALSRADAQAVVSPHKLVRTYAGATETLSLLDGLAVLVVQLSTAAGEIGFALTGNLTDAGSPAPEGVWYTPKEATGSVLLVAPIANVALRFDGTHGAIADYRAGGFFCIHAPTKSEAVRILANVRRNWSRLLAARAARMEALVSGNHALDAGDPDRTKALLWMRLTGDQLVTKQLGTGIYAGLPWFNDYWGRDTFISITGLLFVNGQFKEAAEVFESFAALQDKDPTSKTFGRVPNRARPDGIEYNSADGTPRFIITLADLVNRSGDVALAKRLWPTVRRAVEGVLKNNVDELGLITHDDADTWMDAKEKGVRAWSPRGNRAVDVQTLWVEAFDAALALQYSAEQLLENAAAVGLDMTWRRPVESARAKLISSLALFRDPRTDFLVDHLRPDGNQDASVRPNVLFALGLPRPFGAPEFETNPNWTGLERDMIQARDLWKSLVYPWGVATLSQEDPNFYPYHEHWHYYHKDAAYHNGTVWPWLNGIAIQRLLEFNQIKPAWQLFENMNRQALKEGAIGSLAECADALPLQNARWTRRTGTFLQAWSNAEHLRVWQECFLGIRPSVENGVSIRPRLPLDVRDVRIKVPLANGLLEAHYHKRGEPRWSFAWRGSKDVLMCFDAPNVNTVPFSWSLESDHAIEYTISNGRLSAKTINLKTGTVEEIPEFLIGSQTRGVEFPLEEQARVARRRRALEERVFADLDFCRPRLQPNLKSLSVYHDPPLTY